MTRQEKVEGVVFNYVLPAIAFALVGGLLLLACVGALNSVQSNKNHIGELEARIQALETQRIDRHDLPSDAGLFDETAPLPSREGGE